MFGLGLWRPYWLSSVKEQSPCQRIWFFPSLYDPSYQTLWKGQGESWELQLRRPMVEHLKTPPYSETHSRESWELPHLLNHMLREWQESRIHQGHLTSNVQNRLQPLCLHLYLPPDQLSYDHTAPPPGHELTPCAHPGLGPRLRLSSSTFALVF